MIIMYAKQLHWSYDVVLEEGGVYAEQQRSQGREETSKRKKGLRGKKMIYIPLSA